MAEAEHIIERRAHMLAQKMQMRIFTLKNFITPEGARPPMTQRFNEDKALAWWTQHRYDSLGAAAMQGWKPNEIAELDSALAQRLEAQETML